MRMPEKDPNLWAVIAAAAVALQAFLYAGLVAIVRILRDDKEKVWPRIALEVLLCGLLAQALDSGAKFFFNWDVPTLIAAGVGLLGPEWVRMKANRLANKKVDEL